MHQTFHVAPVDYLASETNLFAEVSNEGLSIFFQNNEDKMITGLSVFSFENKKADAGIANILTKIFDNAELLNDRFNKIYISYAFNESILTPGLYYNANQNNENLALVYGDLHQGIVLSEHVAERNLYNTYRIPEDIHLKMINQFAEAVFIHQYSLLIKQLQHTRNILKIIFYQNKIVATLQKDGKLQIIQAFQYVTAGDIVYHMLNICNQFDVKDITVHLCGMIENDSALFKEIQKYFLAVSFAELSAELSYSDEIKELPGHFFSHLFSFALCV